MDKYLLIIQEKTLELADLTTKYNNKVMQYNELIEQEKKLSSEIDNLESEQEETLIKREEKKNEKSYFKRIKMRIAFELALIYFVFYILPLIIFKDAISIYTVFMGIVFLACGVGDYFIETREKRKELKDLNLEELLDQFILAKEAKIEKKKQLGLIRDQIDILDEQLVEEEKTIIAKREEIKRTNIVRNKAIQMLFGNLLEQQEQVKTDGKPYVIKRSPNC